MDDPLTTLRCAITGRCESELAEFASETLNGPVLVLTPLFTQVPTSSPVLSANDTTSPVATPAATDIPPTEIPTAEAIADLPRITDPRQIQILLLGIDQRSANRRQGSLPN